MYREHWKGITVTPYALVKHWSLLADYVKQVPKVHNCETDGHKWLKLDNFKFEFCQFCKLEKVESKK